MEQVSEINNNVCSFITSTRNMTLNIFTQFILQSSQSLILIHYNLIISGSSSHSDIF